MDILFSLLLLALLIMFIVGMIKPATIGMKGRGKVLLFTLLPFIVVFILFGWYGRYANDQALENADTAEELSFFLKKLDQTPEVLRECKKLKRLSLKKNNLSTLDSSIFMGLTTLEELDLSKNPITELPNWLLQLPNLKKIKVDDTKIEEISTAFTDQLEVSYDDTPFMAKKIEKEKELMRAMNVKSSNSEKDEMDEDDSSSESLGEFAWRNLSGKENGYKVEFETNDEVFYVKPVTEVQAKELGTFLQEMEFFNASNEASVQLIRNTQTEAYEVRFVVDEDKINHESIGAFEFMRTLIKTSVFNDQKTHVILCDNKLNDLKVLNE